MTIVDHISSRKVDEIDLHQSLIGGTMGPTSEAASDNGPAAYRATSPRAARFLRPKPSALYTAAPCVPWGRGREGAL